MGAHAVDLLCAGKSNRVVGTRDGKLMDMDIDEALQMGKSVDEFEYLISCNLSK